MRADGSEILVELAITAFHLNGTPLFTAYLRDITERKRNEEASQRLAAIIQSSEDAIVGTDLSSLITSWNKGAERLFGYPAEEALGKGIPMLLPAVRAHEEPKILERIGRGEHIAHYETQRRRKDGALIDVSLSVSPIKDVDGHVIGASRISRDITDRVRAEQRRDAQYAVANLLAGSETLSEAGPKIIETVAASGNWIFGSIWIQNEKTNDLRCRITWSSGAPKLSQFDRTTRTTIFRPPTGLPGHVWATKKPRWIRDVTQDNNFPRASVAAEAGLRGGFGFPLCAEGDVNGVLELFSSEIIDPDEDLLQMSEALGHQIGLFIHRRKIEDELQSQKLAAEAANAAKDRLLAALSHELRTPLNPVLIWAGGTVKDPNLAPELRAGLEMVCRNVELEARLIDDLLDLTRIARGKVRLHKQPADAHELLRHAITIVHSETANRTITEHVDFAAGQHNLMVDASRLQQAFWNLLRNAYKFTPDQGTITIRTHNETPGYFTVEISDTGVGIEKAALSKIFDAFEQVDTHREGLGLGLAIAKAIVDMHGGKIRAESGGLGTGATFIIELTLP